MMLVAKIDGDSVYMYSLEALWNADGEITLEDTMALTEADFVPFNAINQNMTSLMDHVQRVNDADFSKPIILYSDGRVADGFHRVLHMNMHGITEVPVKRLYKDPAPTVILPLEKFMKKIS